MVRRFCLLFIASILVVSCGKKGTPITPEDTEPVQVTLMYCAGMSLRGDYLRNINCAKDAIEDGALGAHGVFYYLLPSTSDEATLVELSCEDGECVEREVEVYGDFTSLKRESITQVIEDVKYDVDFDSLSAENNPEINLIFSGHGTAWVLGNNISRAVARSQSSIVDPRYWSAEDVLIPTRFFGLENKPTEGCIDIEDLCQAIVDSETKFGYILFDACLMSSIEVLYRMRNLCNYIVASPAEVPGAGFPYNTVMYNLFDNGGRSYDLQGVCQDYYDYYKNNRATVAMCVTSELEGLAEALSNVTLAELTASQQYDLQGYDGFVNHVFFDLGNYVDVAGAMDKDLSAFRAQLDRAFPVECRLHTDEIISNMKQTRTSYVDINYYSGVSTSQSSINTEYNRGWADEPWAVAIGAE